MKQSELKLSLVNLKIGTSLPMKWNIYEDAFHYEI